LLTVPKIWFFSSADLQIRCNCPSLFLWCCFCVDVCRGHSHVSQAHREERYWFRTDDILLLPGVG
jgi:hypothetical protein